MTDEKLTDLVIKITAELSSLNANMKVVLDKLTSHEQRISALEQGKTSLKDATIQWLVKGLISAILIIGSLTGASGLIMKFYGIGSSAPQQMEVSK